DEIRAVVHGHLRSGLEYGLQVAVVALVVLTFLRVHGNAELLHEGGRGVVLRGQRIRGAQRDLGAPRLEGDHEDRGLRGHVHARPPAAPPRAARPPPPPPPPPPPRPVSPPPLLFGAPPPGGEKFFGGGGRPSPPFPLVRGAPGAPARGAPRGGGPPGRGALFF